MSFRRRAVNANGETVRLIPKASSQAATNSVVVGVVLTITTIAALAAVVLGGISVGNISGGFISVKSEAFVPFNHLASGDVVSSHNFQNIGDSNNTHTHTP